MKSRRGSDFSWRTNNRRRKDAHNGRLVLLTSFQSGTAHLHQREWNLSVHELNFPARKRHKILGCVHTWLKNLFGDSQSIFFCRNLFSLHRKHYSWYKIESTLMRSPNYFQGGIQIHLKYISQIFELLWTLKMLTIIFLCGFSSTKSGG